MDEVELSNCKSSRVDRKARSDGDGQEADQRMSSNLPEFATIVWRIARPRSGFRVRRARRVARSGSNWAT